MPAHDSKGPASADVWFIRHGQSTANAGQPTISPEATGLTELGMVQARAVAQALPEAPARFILSPYARTGQTAGPSRGRFPRVPVETWPVQEFTYLSPDIFAGTTTSQRLPEVEDYWQRCDPGFRHGPGAETFAEMTQRLALVLERLSGLTGRSVVFCHGQFMRAVLWRCLDPANAGTPDAAAMARFRALRQGLSVPNGAIVQLRGEPDGWWISPVRTRHLHPGMLTP